MLPTVEISAQALADYIHTTNLYKKIDNRDTVSTNSMGRLVTMLHNIIRRNVVDEQALADLSEVKTILHKRYWVSASVLRIFDIE